MALVALMDSRSRLTARAGTLVVEQGGQQIRTLALHEVRELLVMGGASVSKAARNLLLREGIDVVYLTQDGRYRGRLVGAPSRWGKRRLGQYALVHDADRRLAIARQFVSGKIVNQRSFLLRQQRRLRDESVSQILLSLRAAVGRSQTASNLDQLRGIEGWCAKQYFAALGKAITNPLFRFTLRTRYPPKDPVNACLSYGYSILVRRVENALLSAGLDPYIGCLHETGQGGSALAYDLAEEFRPMVDRAILALVNRRQLSPEDFRTPLPDELGARAELSEDAVYLAKVGKRIVIRAIEARFRKPTPHPVRDGKWPLGELLREQAFQIVRIAEGDQEQYSPVVLPE